MKKQAAVRTASGPARHGEDLRNEREQAEF